MNHRTLAYIIWACVGAVWMTAQIADAAGIRINLTASMPVGLWRVTPLAGPLQRGQAVSFCPPDTQPVRVARARGYIGRGACPSGYEPLLKHVIAITGDVVRLGPEGVTVNGVLAPNSTPLTQTRDGAVPGISFGVVPSPVDAFWAGSPHPRGFDSRYFGPVPTANILGIAISIR